MESYEVAALPRAVALAVSGFGMIVALGWMAGYTILSTFGEGNVSMKFSTAVCFILTAWLFSARREETRFAFGAGIIMIMSTSIMGFYSWDTASHYSIAPGVPSIATAGLFFLMVFSAWWNQSMAFTGTAATAVSALALFGYLVGNPALYYFQPGISSGMAIPTALLFMALGLGILWNQLSDHEATYDYIPMHIKKESSEP